MEQESTKTFTKEVEQEGNFPQTQEDTPLQLKCKECNGELSKYHPCWSDKGFCNDCGHWMDLYEMRLDSDVISIRVEGRHYQTALSSINKSPVRFAGFGGRKFIVRNLQPAIAGYPNEWYTCNMWTQGVIPERFRDRLPDNAEFVNEVTETTVFDGQDFITAFEIK